MGLLKNVASQKVTFPMVDKTDFATPETGITVSGVIRKDGGASAAISNTVSELTNGLYVVTLSQGETNADLLAMRFHDSGASCATQFIIERTDGGKITSILADTGTTLNNKIDSILADTKEINSQADSILADTIAILVDTGSTLSNQITSILADTVNLSNATDGLGALETIVSDILDKVDSILSDTITLNNADYGLNAIETIVSNVYSAMAGPIASILVDTKTTLDDKLDSILADTQNLSNATDGLGALEEIVSDILEALDSVVAGPIASILVDTNTTLDNKIDSILADTITLSNADYGLAALEVIVSDILEAVDSITAGPITSILADSGEISNIKAVTDALTAAAATKLAVSANTMITGTVGATDLTTTTCSTDISLTDAEQLNGRILIFASDTSTAGLKYQATDITGFVVANGVLTFTAVTTAPSAGDTFIIV